MNVINVFDNEFAVTRLSGELPPILPSLDYNVTSEQNVNNLASKVYDRFKVVVDRQNITVKYYQFAPRYRHPMNLQSQFFSQSSVRGVNDFKHLVVNNFSDNDKFLTLTYADSEKSDIKNLVKCNRQRKYFFSKIKEINGDFKYICVPEKKDRGYHFHVIADFEYIKQNVIQDIWGNGIVNVKAIYNLYGSALYLAKYLTKNKGIKGMRRYYCSKNIQRPVVLRGFEAYKVVSALDSNNKIPEYVNDYHSPYHGNIHLSVYKNN